MRRAKLHFLITATALMLPAGIVLGAESGSPKRGATAGTQVNIQAEFGTLDTNANHLIDRNEAKVSEQLENNFDELDENNDGQLSESEFSGFERAHPGPAVSRTQTKALEDGAEATDPTESWFTAPEHKPREDEEPNRGREPR